MEKIKSSFRDPDGYLVKEKNTLCRLINPSYQKNYDLLMSSGLFKALTEKKLLINHREIVHSESSIYKKIQPEIVRMISYPYEWSFSMIQDAALLTLEIEKEAIEYGMTLKDASAYNVQFHHGKPIFIDTLSFSQYDPSKPWLAYRQFCQHFLAPLALCAYKDPFFIQSLTNFIDGIPLELAVKILPNRAKLNFGINMHLYFHAKTQKKHYQREFIVDKNPLIKNSINFSKFKMLALIDSLQNTVKGLHWHSGETTWGDYYSFTNYDKSAFRDKEKQVKELLQMTSSKTVWDIGSNNGLFSLLATKMDIETIALDIDPVAIEKGYLYIKQNQITNLLPLIIDFTNPSPSIGWDLNERDSIFIRANADTVMALALIHHLAIGNNIPLSQLAQFFAKLAKNLIIEFVPKTDSKVKLLLSSREDIFSQYNEQDFEKIFQTYFKIISKRKIKNSKRVLYLMVKK